MIGWLNKANGKEDKNTVKTVIDNKAIVTHIS